MGLIFKKYTKNAYCPQCGKKTTLEVTNWIKYYCSKCNVPYEGSVTTRNNSEAVEHFYTLKKTGIVILENSLLAKILVICPSILLGALGIIPLLFFLLMAIFKFLESASKAIESSFLTIFATSSYTIPHTGAHSVLFRIFNNDWIVILFWFLSAYFGFRLFSFLFFFIYYFHQNQKKVKNRF